MSLEFDPQLATDAYVMTVNSFFQGASQSPPTLVLRPAFQRNLVWNRKQQSYLVDSILRGLPVPELYIQTSVSAEGDELMVVVDGQQRLSACLAFIDGSLVLDDSEELDPRWKGRSFAELPDALKKRFRSFKFVVRSLPDNASDGVMREIFRRLNRTVEVLEPQELRHAAYTGDFIQLVERAGSAVALADLGVFSPKDYLRRRNDEFVAEVLVAVSSGGAFPNKKEGLEDFFMTYEKHGLPRQSELPLRFGRALAYVGQAAPDLKRTRFRNKSDSYSLLVFLACRAEQITGDASQSNSITRALASFSEEVNRIKRDEGAQTDADSESLEERTDENARKYLRAVERAASDRLNRVRRDEALASVLVPVLESSTEVPLRPEDGIWPLDGDDLDLDASPTDLEAEKDALILALLEEG